MPVKTTFQVRVSGSERFTYVAIPTDKVGRHLFWRGLDGYEPESTSIFVTLARSARGIVDAGAHTGLYTLLACAVNSEARVFAFEPVPSITRLLRRNVERNGWSDRCMVFENPVAETDGYVPFHMPATATPLSASLNPQGYGQAGVVTSCYARAIDSCLDQDVPIDLIKIDVEGFEDRAIAGLTRTLNSWSPAVIFEVLETAKYTDIEHTLKESGYDFYKLTARGPEATDSLLPATDPELRNYIAVKQASHKKLLNR
jgi:FkbM family methyltransferase